MAADIDSAIDSEKEIDQSAERITRYLGVAVLFLVIASSVVVFYLTLTAFQKSLKPDILASSSQVTQSVANSLEYAGKIGIPVQSLQGVEAFFDSVIARNRQIESLTLLSPDGTVLKSARRLNSDMAGASEGEEPAAAVQPDTQQADEEPASFNMPLSHLPQRVAGGILDVFATDVPALERDIVVNGQLYGILKAEIAGDYVTGQFRDILFDMVVILVVSLLVAFEIMTAFILFHIVGPIRRLIHLVANGARGRFDTYIASASNDEISQITRRVSHAVMVLNGRFSELAGRLSGQESAADARQRLEATGARFNLAAEGPRKLFMGSFADVRVPLFLFSFADELQKSWLPLYARDLAAYSTVLPPEMVVSLPIAVYMGIIALATPFASRWADSFGARRMFFIGLVPAVAGYMMCALAPNALVLVAGRGVTAFGYAMITIACQGYIAAMATSQNRGRAMAMFVGVLMSATMCGTAIGGVLADRIGYRAVFWISVGLSLAAGLLARSMLLPQAGHEAGQPQMSLLRGISVLMRNPRYTALILLAAIPSKILLTGFLFYTVPLYLAELGSNEAEIGRAMLLYSFTIILFGAMSGRLLDRIKRGGLMLAVGGVISALGLALFHEWGSIWAVVLMVLVMGLGHSVTKSPQITYALELAEEESARVGRTTVMGVLRTTERIGSVLGPILAAFLVSHFGFQSAIFVIGLGIIASSVAFYAIILFMGQAVYGARQGEADS